jgi:superfamily II DNA or RNA helicase
MKMMDPFELRPYQAEAIQSLKLTIAKGNRRVCLCAPTGSGKTAKFTFMVSEHIKRGGRALIITDRIELMKQANGSFARVGLSPELISAGSKPDLTLSCHVGMVETLSRRADAYANFLASRTLIVFDEAHRTAFDKLFPYISDSTFVIGATATPFRDGDQSSMDAFYQDIVQPIDTPDLIEMGYLSEADTYGIDIDLKGIKKTGGDYDPKEMSKRYEERKVYDGVIENYKRICPNTKALAFCSNIESCNNLTEKLVGAGLPARSLDSTMSATDRSEILSWFNSTPNGMLVSVGILTTGFDQPDIQTIILYRATTSLPLFLQMVGRGSRTTETKRRFTILDFGNNIKTHDFWEAERTWSLAKKLKKKKDVPPIRSCPKCNALIPPTSAKCKYCGHVFAKTPKEVEQEEMAKLVLLPKPERLKIAGRSTLQEKARMAKTGVIKAAWVLHNLTSKEDALYFARLMGYKKGWEYYNRERYKVLQ